ncbi:MAG TPA: bifunctional molybdenum cofactor biosynthesis protein MoaC/MoaB [Bacteroidetes bacterium]|nr:bifunctional molybdenum cofactor biosynthesis protein MoaC/MoaB [Bacteroidota bacterium]
MIDVSPKFNTLRYARAEGFLACSAESLQKIAAREVPKGDVVEVARAAGIAAAKRTADWIVFCHPIPIDWIEVTVTPEKDGLLVRAEVRSVWKTGVEMEALTAVSAALLNAYDMLKPIDSSLTIGEIRLVEKKGGKSDFTESLPRPLTAAVLVISDSTFAGKREDKSGRIIEEFLGKQQIEVAHYEVLPDDRKQIAERLRQLADGEQVDLIFTTSGTGLGPKDVTQEATREVIEREAPGIAEAIRKYGKDRTPYAMLSRGVCGVRGGTLIVNLPGSSRGAKESLEALFPGLLHAFSMMWGGGH